MYDKASIHSILTFAKHLKDKSLRQVCGDDAFQQEYKGKGSFGQKLEKYYFGYEPNSVAEPDFDEVSVELKSSPLKTLKNGEIRSKERLVLNIINYLKVHGEGFSNSSFWTKNQKLLLVFYLYEKGKLDIDFIIKLVDLWEYPKDDVLIIKQDWETIKQKILDGRAHELSEGDTLYLGACTKGSTAAKSLREQPFSDKPAKQRAYSLKQGYVNHIIATLAGKSKVSYGKIIQKGKTLNEVLISKFEIFYGLTPSEIELKLGLHLSKSPKSYFANLTKAILGVELGQKIEEFQKADIQVKTVRLKSNNTPCEDISFPTFKYYDILEIDWDDSQFKEILESKFFFVFYQYNDQKALILKKVMLWNMPYADRVEAQAAWIQTTEVIQKGNIVKSIDQNGRRSTNFPNKKANRVSHVRPHAQNAQDTYPLPFKDKVTGLDEYTKHCFWFNASYVRDEIYLKY